MTYQWKTPYVMPVDAQSAGEELDRIYQKHGNLIPSNVVEESRDETSVLHPCFEWNDAAAAEKYRETQAGLILRNITVVSESVGNEEPVRAFVSVQKSYQPIEIVLSDQEKTEELLRNALKELVSFKAKYNTLSMLKPVFDAIEKVSA